MISKPELRYALDTIVVDILDDIISPIINEPRGVLKVDSYLTNLEEFFDKKVDLNRALREIIEKYKLSKEAREYLDGDFSLIQLATYILCFGCVNEDYRSLS